jgi:hypothetical protein
MRRRLVRTIRSKARRFHHDHDAHPGRRDWCVIPRRHHGDHGHHELSGFASRWPEADATRLSVDCAFRGPCCGSDRRAESLRVQRIGGKEASRRRADPAAFREKRLSALVSRNNVAGSVEQHEAPISCFELLLQAGARANETEGGALVTVSFPRLGIWAHVIIGI